MFIIHSNHVIYRNTFRANGGALTFNPYNFIIKRQIIVPTSIPGMMECQRIVNGSDIKMTYTYPVGPYKSIGFMIDLDRRCILQLITADFGLEAIPVIDMLYSDDITYCWLDLNIDDNWLDNSTTSQLVYDSTNLKDVTQNLINTNGARDLFSIVSLIDLLGIDIIKNPLSKDNVKIYSPNDFIGEMEVVDLLPDTAEKKRKRKKKGV